MKKIIIAIAILASFTSQAQIKQVLIEQGYAIAKDGDTVVTQPRVIYANGGGFVVNVRIIATADTTMGEYAVTRHQYTQGKFGWTRITNSRRCKMTWPVLKEVSDAMEKTAGRGLKLAVN